MPGHPRDVPRKAVSLRLDQAGIDAIQAMADDEQRSWSEMVRLLLADGMTARQQQRIKGRRR